MTINLNEIFTTLDIIDNKNHKSHWEDMANKLNDTFKELDIVEDKKQITKEYIEKYISGHTIYLINDKLFVLKNNSEYFNKIQTMLDRGTTNIDWCSGRWYELKFDPNNIEGFDFFMVYKNHTKENIYTISSNNIDYYTDNNYFKKTFIKDIKLEITETKKYKNWEEVPKEILDELNEIWKDTPIS